MGRLPPDWFEKLHTFIYFGTLGAFAAVVGYLVQLARNEGQTMSLLVLVVTVIAGFYVGMLFGALLPAEWGHRDAIVLLMGASGMKGVEILTSLSREQMKEKIKSWLK